MFQRHSLQNGVPMFVTTNIHQRKSIFGNPAYAREAIETLYRVQELHPFLLFGFVIMPDHCHFLLNVPAPETISKVMNIFKSGVSHNLGLGKIWQTRFDLKIPRSRHAALNYIHQNPVKAGLTDYAENYKWSSASGKWDITAC